MRVVLPEAVGHSAGMTWKTSPASPPLLLSTLLCFSPIFFLSTVIFREKNDYGSSRFFLLLENSCCRRKLTSRSKEVIMRSEILSAGCLETRKETLVSMTLTLLSSLKVVAVVSVSLLLPRRHWLACQCDGPEAKP